MFFFFFLIERNRGMKNLIVKKLNVTRRKIKKEKHICNHKILNVITVFINVKQIHFLLYSLFADSFLNTFYNNTIWLQKKKNFASS